MVSGGRRIPHHVDGSSTTTRHYVNHTVQVVVESRFRAKRHSRTNRTGSRQHEPATTRLALIPLVHAAGCPTVGTPQGPEIGPGHVVEREATSGQPVINSYDVRLYEAFSVKVVLIRIA